MTPHILRELVASVDPVAMCQHSFLNYHAVGIDYLCLFRSVRLTAKVYVLEPELPHNDRGWIIWPHTHAYTFEHWTVAGEILHHRFRLADGAEWWLHEYANRTSAPVLRVGLQQYPVAHLLPGNHYVMAPDEIHTISKPNDEPAIAFQLQYHDQRSRTALFAPTTDVRCGNDARLYQAMSPQQYRDLLNRVKEVA